MLVPSAMLQHESQIIEVGRDIEGLDSIEVLHFLAYLPTCFSNSCCYIIGQFHDTIGFGTAISRHLLGDTLSGMVSGYYSVFIK